MEKLLRIELLGKTKRKKKGTKKGKKKGWGGGWGGRGGVRDVERRASPLRRAVRRPMSDRVVGKERWNVNTVVDTVVARWR